MINVETKEYLILQFGTFGQCFCYKGEAVEVLEILLDKFDTFKFNVEFLHGGIYISKVR